MPVDPVVQILESQRRRKGIGARTCYIVYHFQYPKCYTYFWTFTRPSPVRCPEAACGANWIPDSMDGEYERGVKEEITPKDR